MVSGSLMVNTLLIDNYDSFTYNLYALLSVVNGTEPTVIRNDSSWDAIDFDRFDNIVVSPGPGSPTQVGDFGISARIIAETDLPLLGVCLGHQGLCSIGGARIVRAPEPVHGRLSEIVHNGDDLFRGLPSSLSAVRYHSLVVADLPAELEVTARTTDGLIMAVRHRNRPMWGLQFHPESIASEHGHDILTNFRNGRPAVARPRRAALPSQSAAVAPRPIPAASNGEESITILTRSRFTNCSIAGRGRSGWTGLREANWGLASPSSATARGRTATASYTTSPRPRFACTAQACRSSS
jgi:para-aminobenzoate synthetase